MACTITALACRLPRCEAIVIQSPVLTSNSAGVARIQFHIELGRIELAQDGRALCEYLSKRCKQDTSMARIDRAKARRQPWPVTNAGRRLLESRLAALFGAAFTPRQIRRRIDNGDMRERLRKITDQAAGDRIIFL